MATLERLGLEENTLVIFTADQGSAGGQHGLWGMGDHTRPLHAFDGTMHIPLIARQPGSIPAERTSDILTSNYDLLPTVLDYLKLADKLPAKPALPGRSYARVLRGEAAADWKNEVFYEFENVRAIRTPQWKYVERIHQRPNELYNLAADPDEHHNLYGQPEHERTLLSLRRRLHRFFDEHADPKWDLWHGGRSKTDIFTEKLFGITNPYVPSKESFDDPPRAANAP